METDEEKARGGKRRKVDEQLHYVWIHGSNGVIKRFTFPVRNVCNDGDSFIEKARKLNSGFASDSFFDPNGNKLDMNGKFINLENGTDVWGVLYHLTGNGHGEISRCKKEN